MGEEVAKIDVTDFRKRYTVNREAAGLPIKPGLKFEPIASPLTKELKDADRVRR